MIFRMQRNSTALRTVPHPKLISAGRLVLAENKASGILLPNPPSGIGGLFLRMKFPVRPNEFPVRAKNRESCARHWDCSANRRAEMVGSVENSLFFPVLRESGGAAPSLVARKAP